MEIKFMKLPALYMSSFTTHYERKTIMKLLCNSAFFFHLKGHSELEIRFSK